MRDQAGYPWELPEGRAGEKGNYMEFHTFVICAYGRSPYLEACIRSLKAQTVASKIICATSTPSPWLEEVLGRHGIPLFVREGPGGIGNDWNFGLERARARFVTIAHQDDLYNRHYVEELSRAAAKWPDMTVFMSDGILIRGGKLSWGGAAELVKKILRLPWRFSALCGLSWVKKAGLVLGNPVMCPSCSYRRDQLPQPLFSTEYDFVLDWECMRRLAGLPGRFVCVEKPLLYYRIHDGAATKACMEDHRREREERRMFQDIWPGRIAGLIMRLYSRAGKNYQ